MDPERDAEELARRFQSLALSRAEWTHEAHLIVGLWHVARFGADEAMVRLRTGIRALNEHNGVANTSTGGYHETITQAYVRLLAHFLEGRGVVLPAPYRDLTPDVADLLAGVLAGRSVLFGYWTRDRLLSPAARTAWVDPDRANLPHR